mgnify:CR=1 FL=1
MKFKKIYIVVLIVCLHSGMSYCLSIFDPGTSGAPFLELQTGFRNIHLGDANITDQSGDGLILNNPAGLASALKNEVGISGSKHIRDAQFGNIYYINKKNKRPFHFGISISYLTTTPMQVTTWTYPLGEPDKTFYYSSMFGSFGIGYKFKKTKVSIGGNLKIYSESINYSSGSQSVAGYTVMIGVSSIFQFNKFFKTGIIIDNIGPGIKFDQERDKLPAKIKIGVSYKIFEIDIYSSFVQIIGGYRYFNVGLNYSPKIDIKMPFKFAVFGGWKLPLNSGDIMKLTDRVSGGINLEFNEIGIDIGLRNSGFLGISKDIRLYYLF